MTITYSTITRRDALRAIASVAACAAGAAHARGGPDTVDATRPTLHV